jgi:tetratricopeptide (TPR) repeat protein
MAAQLSRREFMSRILAGGAAAAVFALAALPMTAEAAGAAVAAWAPGAGAAGATTSPTSYAELQRIMKQSRRTYSFVAADGPIAKPAAPMSCPEHIPLLRVVVDAHGERQLVIWQPAAAAAPHFEAAEKLFAADQRDQAEWEYRRGLELDPSYGPGWLFSGDIPYGRGKFALALDSYRKAIALDPTLPQPHRFAGDALAGLGKLAEAEDEYIAGLSWDPSYRGVVEGLTVLGGKAGFRVYLPDFHPPPAAFGESADGKVLIRADPEWQAYLSCRAVWRYEPGYRERRLGRAASETSLSVMEESECLATYATANYAATEQRLAQAAKDQGREGAAFDTAAVYAAGPPALQQAAQAVSDGVGHGLVLFLIAQQCPVFGAMQTPEGHAEIERYIRREVVVGQAAPTPKRP